MGVHLFAKQTSAVKTAGASSMKTLNHLLTLICTVLICFSIIESADAHVVKKVKGKKILIKLSGDTPSAGQYYYVINKSGKKKGIIKIKKVKKKRAIGLIRKGKAKKGWKLVLKPKKKKESEEDNDGQASMYWGGMLGFAMNTMSVQFTDGSGSVDLTGSGFSGKALFDFALFDSIWFRGLWGAETFNTTGNATSASCDSTTTCKVNIVYLTADLWARYIFSKKEWRPWVGAGFLVLFPMTKDVNALNSNSITNTSNFSVGGGVDWFFSKDMFIPIQVEYDLYPSSSTVSASSIAIRAGFGMEF